MIQRLIRTAVWDLSVAEDVVQQVAAVVMPFVETERTFAPVNASSAAGIFCVENGCPTVELLEGERWAEEQVVAGRGSGYVVCEVMAVAIAIEVQ